MAFFADKVAVVTGGGQGMGAAYGRLLAERGAAVVLADINEERAAETAADITRTGGKAAAVRTDVSSEHSAIACAAFAERTFGGIDFLVNNAGLLSSIREKPLTEIDFERYLSITAVNMHGVLLMTRAVLPALRARKGGAIVNMSSIAAYLGGGIYNLNKLGVNGLTVALAKELAPDNIRVNAVAPGTILTEGNLEMKADEKMLSAWAMSLGKKTPEVGRPNDVVNVGIFLLSEEARYVSGQIIAVDGATIVRV